jgi:hypothetical protein
VDKQPWRWRKLSFLAVQLKGKSRDKKLALGLNRKDEASAYSDKIAAHKMNFETRSILYTMETLTVGLRAGKTA